MKKSILGLVLFVLAAQADDIFNPTTLKSLNEQEKARGVSGDLKQNEFYLNIDPKDIKEVQNKDKILQETFDKFDNAIINYNPAIRPLATTDEINVHPYFTTTILLPADANISFGDISVPPQKFEWDKNTAIVRVKKDFEICNLTLIYTLEKKNYVLNMILKRYDRKNTNEKLNIVYSYRNIKKRDDLYVLQEYIKIHGYPKKKESYIYIDGIAYRISQDNKSGNLIINNKKYLVDIGDAR